MLYTACYKSMPNTSIEFSPKQPANGNSWILYALSDLCSLISREAGCYQHHPVLDSGYMERVSECSSSFHINTKQSAIVTPTRMSKGTKGGRRRRRRVLMQLSLTKRTYSIYSAWKPLFGYTCKAAKHVEDFFQSNSTVPGTAGRFWGRSCFPPICLRFLLSWSLLSSFWRVSALAFFSFHFTAWSRFATTQSKGPNLPILHFKASKNFVKLKEGGKYTYQQDWKGDVCPSSPTHDGLHESGTKSDGMVYWYLCRGAMKKTESTRSPSTQEK